MKHSYFSRRLLSVFMAFALGLSVLLAKDFVVVIDAGHGGHDPGSLGSKAKEKNINLGVALKLGRLIENNMQGVKVVYTRKLDKALGTDLATDLQARADIANGAGGDLFISIHVNAARATAARGVETLIMGESPKEQRYNENALYESNREDLIDMSDERTAAIVRAYIQNLQFTYGEYSMALARFVQNNYISSGRHSRGVKPQLLRVLYATDMPGVLTEIGFMTNPQEMAYMKSEKGQNEIARNIYQAVRDYSDYVLKIRKSEGGAVPAEPAVPAEDTAREKPRPAPAPAKETAKDTSRSVPSRPAAGEKQASAAGQGAKAPAAEQPLRYAVQVMASSKAVPLTSSQFRSYRGKVKEYASEGRFPYKYCVGEYADRAAAQKRLREVRKAFPEAFVVSVQGGRVVK